MDSSQSGGPAGVTVNNSVISSSAKNEAASTTSTPATATSSSDDPKQSLTDVINSTEKTLGLLHRLYLNVSSFNVGSQMTLLERINSLVGELDNMAKLSEKCNIQVPMEVLNLIDDGKNPDEFTRDVINNCISKNQITKGKADSFKGLRKHLLEEIEQAFPEEIDTYRDIRASSAAEAKRLSKKNAQSVLPNGDMKIKNEP